MDHLQLLVTTVFANAGAQPAGSPTDPLAVALVLAGVAILAIIMLISARQKLIRGRGQPSEARQQYDRLRRMAGNTAADPDVANARLHERAQQLAAVLDNKAARLEQLIAEADTRIAKMQTMSGAPSNARASDRTASAAPMKTPAQRPQPQTKPEQASSAQPVIETKPAPAATATNPPRREHSRGTAPVKTLDPTTQQVYQLADQGHSPVEIAQKMDEQIGKVELILALRPTSPAHASST